MPIKKEIVSKTTVFKCSFCTKTGPRTSIVKHEFLTHVLTKIKLNGKSYIQFKTVEEYENYVKYTGKDFYKPNQDDPVDEDFKGREDITFPCWVYENYNLECVTEVIRKTNRAIVYANAYVEQLTKEISDLDSLRKQD